MDAGPLVKVIERTLLGDEKASKVLADMFTEGTHALILALPGLWDGSIIKVPQKEEDATHAPKMNTSESR
jgi:methionyl-tRNA formyltransferase